MFQYSVYGLAGILQESDGVTLNYSKRTIPVMPFHRILRLIATVMQLQSGINGKIQYAISGLTVIHQEPDGEMLKL